MKPQTRTHFTLSLLTAGILCASTAAWAANVPAGTALADKQELVRNNGSEPASLDPHKVESDVEFNIISDLFEGLVGVSPAGEVQPDWRKNGRTRTTPSGRSICARASPGATARRLPLRMWSGAGSA
jgi:ABC-type oligopeptide transport system substrate-binding subunit